MSNTATTQTITTGPVDIALLRRQRGVLLDMEDRGGDWTEEQGDAIAGVLNLLDHLLDRAEGFA